MTDNIGFLFDLDGVLIDSESQYSQIWAQINREFPTGVENLEEVIKGCTLHKILSDHYPEERVRESVADRLHELEQQMHYEYLPGSHEFLLALKEKGLPIALVTSSDEKKMNHLREELPDFLELFDFVVTAGMVQTSKPSPEGYLLAASHLKAAPRNCAIFEDSLQGVMAGRNSEALVVGVCGTLGMDVLSEFSDLLVDHLNEIELETLIRILKLR